MDDAPPPPYSVRDPHSSSPAQRPNPAQSITAFNALADGAPSTNLGLTARRPSGQTSAPALSSALNRHQSSQVLTASITPSTSPSGIPREELDKAGFVSAAPYFELRTLDEERPRNTFYHRMAIAPDARPDNLPFPQPRENWTSRGVDDQDWMTFLNHMFPTHGTKRDRKGSQGLEVDADLEMANLRLSNSRSRDQSRPLLAGNSAGASTGGQDWEIERLRRVRIHAVSSQWNEGFFGPRGLEVLVEIRKSIAPVPVETALPLRRNSSNVLQKRPPPEAEETLLHQLVAKGKKSQVKLLLEKSGEDIEALNKKQETCLYRAVSRGDKEIVQLLLKYNADPTARPPGSDSPLHVACYNDRKSIIKNLLERSRFPVWIEEPNPKGETPLYVALQRRHNSCIEILLDAGANPNARPVGKDSMLNIVVSSDSKSIAKLLLQKGVDVEELKGGETPLYRAITRGNTSMVKLLLEYGASAAARTIKGEAPLSLATARGDKSVVSLLLAQNDIDVEVENERHETPLWTAVYRAHNSIAEQLLRKGADPGKSPLGEERMLNLAVSRGSTSLTHLLLERGANFEEKNRSGESPLFQAVSRGDTSIVSLLLGKGANTDTHNPAGESALQRAVSRASASTVSLLLGKGANPDLKIVSGELPLYIAVYRSDTSIVSILLSHGANPTARSLSGELPLSRAIYVGSTSIVSLLLSRGADPAAKTVTGDSMIEYALKRGNKTIIQLLTNCSPPKLQEKNFLG